MKNPVLRIELFSDAVMAIIITVLVLEIPMPEALTIPSLLHTLHYIFTFAVSFFIIASYWDNHRFLFEHIKKLTKKIVWRNFLFLFFISILPVFANWAVENMTSRLTVISYGCMLILVNFSYMFLFVGALEQMDFSHFPRPLRSRDFVARSLILIIFIAIVIGIAVFKPQYAFYLFIGVPLIKAFMNLWVDVREEGLS